MCICKKVFILLDKCKTASAVHLTELTAERYNEKYKVNNMDYTEFKNKYGSEELCREYLINTRWKNGFLCPKCEHTKAWQTKENKYKCQSCGYQISATAGTIFQDLHISLDKWFHAIWYVCQHDYKITPSDLYKELGLGSKHTAKKLLQKLELAKANIPKEVLASADNTKLRGTVEIVTSSVGFSDGLSKNITCAVEINKNRTGNIKLSVMDSSISAKINDFVEINIETGSMLIHKWWKECDKLLNKGYSRERKSDDYTYPYANKVLMTFRVWFRNNLFSNNDLTKCMTRYCAEYNSDIPSVKFEDLLKSAINTKPQANIPKDSKIFGHDKRVKE